MKEKEAAVISRVRLPTVTTVDETWKKATDAIRQAARLELGITKPGRRKVDKQTLLWTDDVKAKKSVPWTLLYADDVMLDCEDKDDLGRCKLGAVFELKLNVKKTEYLTTDVSESGSIKINGTELARTSVLKYLGSAIASDSSLMVEVNSRVSAAWSKWRSLTGVLCDRKIPEHLESKIYRAVEVETRLNVMETKMLRWTAGITRMDRIRNDAIRQKFGDVPIADKVREARLRWYGHVLRGK
ncbi:unnamed protein product [Heligmosomoides polygyrus]|uniref:Reverse transcriptase domain-containing protein n=1 Tax=Heligmosomoides polygyrus TaxID=6339 RepID=A0A183FDL2_HELPZ|nr:unnamed protein product [Heligmosomoides polygyrus]